MQLSSLDLNGRLRRTLPLAVLLPLLLLVLAAGATAATLRSGELVYPRALAIELGPLERDMTAAPESGLRMAPVKPGAVAEPLQVGAGRQLALVRTSGELQRQLLWQQLPNGGLVATIHLESSGAHGVRLALEAEQVPDGAEFRFFDREGKALHLVTGARINRMVALNLLSGAAENEARTYWSPLLAGDFIGLEIYLSSEEAPDQLVMAIPALSHLFAPLEPRSRLKLAPGQAADCHFDVNCFPEWELERNAVAVMFFNIGENTFQCSGTLLNDRDNSNSPYFLTARHCIDNQLKATTAETLWFWYSTACNSRELNENFGQVSGAEFLQGHAATDMALLELLGPLPPGVTFAGWSITPPLLGTQVAGLHHPESDLQKFASGLLRGHYTCTIDDDSLFCREADRATGSFVDVNFTIGTIELGSSGSGLFAEFGGYLLGTLSGGSASCANPAGTNFYGRFDKAFEEAPLWPWLDPDRRFFTEDLNRVEAQGRPMPPPDPTTAGGGGGCFIATAAYGSAEAPQVLLLRQFRDQILLRSQLGRRLVVFYYRHSPAVAQWLTRHPEARVLVRTALMPVVAAARLALVLAEAREPEPGDIKISLADRLEFC